MSTFVGIDWGSEEHAVCVMRKTGEVVASCRVGHDTAGLRALVERAGGEAALVSTVFVLERRDGLLVDSLLDVGATVWYINPKQVDRFRDRYSMAGSKNDKLDARVLADAARTDPHAFRTVAPRPAELVELKGVGRLHSSLTEQRVRLENQGMEALTRYYPALVALRLDLGTDWARKLFKLAPTPGEGRRLSRRRIDGVLHGHGVRKVTADQVVECLRGSHLEAAQGVELVERLAAESAVRQLDVVVDQLRKVERRIDELLAIVCAAPEGSALAAWAFPATALRSIPGVGSKIAATILAEAPEALRDGDYHDLRANAGVAPVTKATGKRSKTPLVHMRYACNGHLRDAMHHWGRTAAQADEHWGDYRRRCVARGHTPGRASRQVADRLLRVLAALVRTRTHYDAQRWTTPAQLAS